MNTHKYTTHYSVDRNHQIVSVDENWKDFAVNNDAPELATGSVIGRSLWEFISDHETREAYRQMIWRAFAGRSTTFDIRCDSPEQRRTAQLSIYRTADGNVEIAVHTTKIEARPPQELLRRHEHRALGTVTECSFCNKIQTGPSEWLEVEDAVGKLRIYGREFLPDLLHGVCPSCHDRLDAQLSDRRQKAA